MKKLILLAIAVVLMAAAAPASISRPKPWTLKFRTDFNEGCVESLLPTTAVPEKQLIEVRNFCDCLSDGVQDRYSEQDTDKYLKINNPEFDRFIKKVAESCAVGTI